MVEFNRIGGGTCEPTAGHDTCYYWLKHQPDSSGRAYYFMEGHEGGFDWSSPRSFAGLGDIFVYFDGELYSELRGVFNTAFTVPKGVTVDVAIAPAGSAAPEHPSPKKVRSAEIISAIGATAPEATKPFSFEIKWRNTGNAITNYELVGKLYQGVSLREEVHVNAPSVPIGTQQTTTIPFVASNTTPGQGELKVYVVYNGDVVADIQENLNYRQPGVEEPPTTPPPETGKRYIEGKVTDSVFNTPVVGATVCFEGKCKTSDLTGFYAIENPALATAKLTATAFGYQNYEKWIESPTSGSKRENIKIIKGAGNGQPPAEKTLKQKWEDFFAQPDIITAIGLTPSSIQESFSLVFSNYSIIYDMPADPQVGDYVSVGLILAGVSLATIGAVYAAISAIGGVSLVAISDKATYAYLQIPIIKSIIPRIQGWLTSPTALKTLLGSAIGLIGTDTFVKFIGEESIQTAGMGVWIAIDSKNWSVAADSLVKYRTFINNLKFEVDLVGYLNPVAYNSFKGYYEAAEAQADAYEEIIKTNYPAYGLPDSEHLPFTITGITDGDTVTGKTDAGVSLTIRLSGIDAPENNTAAGKASTQYLQSIALNKKVTLDIDPAHKTDKYGRVLARIMSGVTNINLEMLKKSHAVYWVYEPNKYVDDKTYQAASKAPPEGGITPPAEAGAEFKILITSEPSNAKVYIDGIDAHHRTPSDEIELARPPYNSVKYFTPGSHKISATKSGMTAEKTVTLTSGDNGVINLVLGSGMAPKEETKTPEQILAGFDQATLEALFEALKKLLGK